MPYKYKEEEYIDYCDNPDQIPRIKTKSVRYWVDDDIENSNEIKEEEEFTWLEIFLFGLVILLILIII